MKEPITLKNDFLTSFLMIVDELQTYGRLPQNLELGKEVLNPKYVGFQWFDDSNKLQLTYDKNFVKTLSNTKLIKAYKKHNNKVIIAALENKVNKDSLDFLEINHC